jgi:2-polyprenyl-6-methoxyphenol hydroxylase-like FAD-dependent oxidoreductase
MHGNVKLRQDSDDDTDRPEIDRRDLRLMLLDAVPKDKIQWGKKIEEVRKREDGKMAVHFANGSSESGFRLVVGADGAWSKCRRLVGFRSLSLTSEISLTSEGHVKNTTIRREILHHK